MKVKHTLYPVSYISADGRQINALWLCEPTSNHRWCGAPIVVEADHPDELPKPDVSERIAELEAELEALRAKL